MTYTNMKIAPYSICVPAKNVQIRWEVYYWLETEIGGPNIDWWWFDHHSRQNKFYFNFEEDKVKFILRWL